MRLINTTTYLLEEFFGATPPYAILSHTWDRHEVSFQDWESDRDVDSRKQRSAKIRGACEQARRDGYDFLWCDTNCIDKKSSAELTEAINSMYAWYQRARVCYAYLSDVDGASGCGVGARMLQFAESRWFTRGWTLQELLAPETLIFFDKTWTCVGSRDDRSLSWKICKITGIHEPYLSASSVFGTRREISTASVAERLSWLSQRATTREEDMSYCMLGIFDINMPLLYGEGPKAFVRLQEEIIKVSNDHTIFCWRWKDEYVPAKWASMLSPSPKAFQGAVGYMNPPPLHQRRFPYAMTNLGLSIRLPIVNYGGRPAMCLALLNVRERVTGAAVGITLYETLAMDIYHRVPFPEVPVLINMPHEADYQDIRVPAQVSQLPRIVAPWSGDFQDLEYAVLFSYRDDIVYVTVEYKLMPRSLLWSDLKVLKLVPFAQPGQFGGILPLWVRFPKDNKSHQGSQRDRLQEGRRESLVFVFFGVKKTPSQTFWLCQVLGVVDGPPRFEVESCPFADYGSESEGSGKQSSIAHCHGRGASERVSKALQTYQKRYREMLHQMELQLSLIEPPQHMARRSDGQYIFKRLGELGISIQVDVGPSTKANNRAQISVAHIHFSDNPIITVSDMPGSEQGDGPER
jgi:hypothetical protein